MNRYGARRKHAPASEFLTYNDLMFCMEYTKNGQNGTRAYHSVHPKSSLATARAEAVRVLSKSSVKDQLDRMYKAAIPDTIETIKRDLELAYNMAVAAKDHAAIAAITMDKAKLAGLLVDKREVKTIDDAEQSPIRQLVAASLPTLSLS